MQYKANSKNTKNDATTYKKNDYNNKPRRIRNKKQTQSNPIDPGNTQHTSTHLHF